MRKLMNKLFGTTTSETLEGLFANGATIIDVRTKAEFDGAHVRESQNIPLDTLKYSTGQLDKTQNYIIVCASGIRSRDAVGILKEEGFENVFNGGSWTRFL